MIEKTNKMDDSRQQTELKQCPICNNHESKFLFTKNTYRICQCPECGVEYVANAPTKETLNDYYSRKEWFEGGEEGGYQNYDEQTLDSIKLIEGLLKRFAGKEGSLLDIGCGYGGHLAMAAELGWQCFGVEPSEHAKTVAEERLGGLASIVSKTEEIIPHTFDVILMLDVIEHVSNPYELFYPLFASGAIQPHTIVIITTPNTGSVTAIADPENWAYRHPPSHLTYFTKKSLEAFFKAIRFTQVTIQGLHPLEADTSQSELTLERYAGLLLEATGSDFQQFMQERYVPGTWSEIAEYEHLPRYRLACGYAKGLTVLDFGCGTGYGTAMLANVAGSALGIDIDSSALEWARRSHRHANLSFQQNGDFLTDFDENAFDLITCFEMIEHVTESDQYKAISALARVLKPEGQLLISTPNPEITSLYGANPYHLRERSREEFIDLLSTFFKNVQIVDQYALAGVFFSSDRDAYQLQSLNNGPISAGKALAYIALCSNSPTPKLENKAYVDTDRDYISTRLQLERKLTKERLECYLSKRRSWTPEQPTSKFGHIILDSKRALSEQISRLTAQKQELIKQMIELCESTRQAGQCNTLNGRYTELEHSDAIKRRRLWHRLGESLKATGIHQNHTFRNTYLLARALKHKLLQSVGESPAAKYCINPVILEPNNQAYIVRQPHPRHPTENRPVILHIIANFCLGGSSRLVVDLIESLGGSYEQPVVTSYLPKPSAYLNLKIHKEANANNHESFLALIDHYRPQFVHIHYWGDCDKSWYAQAFSACEKKGIRVIQNINTPVLPYSSPTISHNVYVSDHVREIYGHGDNKALVIHPGSNLEHFSVQDLSSQADDCIGMVYRLETDKLNSSSIDVFIQVALRRPATRCLIVGDGSLKSAFEKKVAQAGVSDSFEFIGYVPYQDLPSFYRQMSIFVAPVWKESFGQVSSFAMNMGLPVVGYEIGAIPSIINDASLVVDYGDSQGLADVIVKLLENRNKRLEIGRRNHEKAQAEYSVDAMIKAYSSLYASMSDETTI